jgi:hypothetical protein
MSRLTFEVAHGSYRTLNTNALPWFYVVAMLLAPCNLEYNKRSRVDWIDALSFVAVTHSVSSLVREFHGRFNHGGDHDQHNESAVGLNRYEENDRTDRTNNAFPQLGIWIMISCRGLPFWKIGCHNEHDQLVQGKSAGASPCMLLWRERRTVPSVIASGLVPMEILISLFNTLSVLRSSPSRSSPCQQLWQTLRQNGQSMYFNSSIGVSDGHAGSGELGALPRLSVATLGWCALQPICVAPLGPIGDGHTIELLVRLVVKEMWIHSEIMNEDGDK